MIAASYPLLDAFLTILWVFLFAMWAWTLAMVVLDLFRSGDLSGVAKAAWFLFVLFLPVLGVLAYVLLRGDSMADRSLQRARASEDALRSYIKDVAGTPTENVTEQLVKLSALHDRHVISDDEYKHLKDRLVA